MSRVSKTILIVLAVVLAAALLLGAGGAYLLKRQTEAAQQAHATVHQTYQTFRRNALQSTLTLVEEGREPITVAFAELGLLEDLNRQIDAQFTDMDRLDEASFAALPYRQQLEYTGHSADAGHLHSAVASPASLNIDSLYQQLSIGRSQPQPDAYSCEGGVFTYTPPAAGNELVKDQLYQALYIEAGSYAVNSTAPASYTFDVTAANCYTAPPQPAAPEAVAETLAGMLAEQIAGMEVSVEMYGGTICSLTTGTLSSLLSLDESGFVVLDEERLRSIIAQWAETYDKSNEVFVLDTYAGGAVTIPFITCDRVLDQEGLFDALAPRLTALESPSVKADFLALDETGKDLGLTSTYIEVDMTNQLMTFFKDGAVVVSTPIVSGNNMYTSTPRGLYYTSKMERNTTLYGPTWQDFVEYWVAITDDNILGIHDASWRSEFGGTIFLKDGSHGCINTPSEAMATLYDNVEIGTAVLIYHRVEPDTLYNR